MIKTIFLISIFFIFSNDMIFASVKRIRNVVNFKESLSKTLPTLDAKISEKETLLKKQASQYIRIKHGALSPQFIWQGEDRVQLGRDRVKKLLQASIADNSGDLDSLKKLKFRTEDEIEWLQKELEQTFNIYSFIPTSLDEEGSPHKIYCKYLPISISKTKTKNLIVDYNQKQLFEEDVAVASSGWWLKSPTNSVRSCSSGKVVKIGKLKHRGNYIVIDHGSRKTTVYANIVKLKPGLKVGSWVRAGQSIGEHKQDESVYFEARRYNLPVNPRSMFSKKILNYLTI